MALLCLSTREFAIMSYWKQGFKAHKLLILFSLAAASVAVPTAVHNGKLPNIVFVMADDMGYGDVGYNGGAADTPNLDAMASGSNSVHLTRHYSGGPVCSPTRGTVLTGRNHNRYCIWLQDEGVTCNDITKSTTPLPPTEITVAELLKQQGYSTAAFGKWHLGDLSPCTTPSMYSHPLWPVSHPGVHGFDTWWMTERAVPTIASNCPCFERKSQCVQRYRQTLAARRLSCSNYYSMDNTITSWPSLIAEDDSHFTFERFADFLQSVKSGQQFFAYIALHTPHFPFIATDHYFQHYSSRGYTEEESNYYGAITALDDAIGHIQELLNTYNYRDNTLFWFTSDNGPAHRRSLPRPGSTAGLRGYKGTLYEGGIRVPGIIEWPAVIKKNYETDFPVVTSDLLPTVCDILGIDPPADRPIDGTSILPLLRGEVTARNESIGWMYPVVDGNFDSPHNEVIMNNNFKLFAKYDNGQIQRAQLYDLARDRSETRDVKGEHPELLESMKQHLAEWRQSVIRSANEEVQCVGHSVKNPVFHCNANESPVC